MHTYFCLKCYGYFRLETIDNETGSIVNVQSSPNTCPYCGREKLVLIEKLE